jgi:hypothetical protein
VNTENGGNKELDKDGTIGFPQQLQWQNGEKEQLSLRVRE